MVKHKDRQLTHCYEIGTQGMQSVYDIFTRIAFHFIIRGGQVGFSSYNNSPLTNIQEKMYKAILPHTHQCTRPLFIVGSMSSLVKYFC